MNQRFDQIIESAPYAAAAVWTSKRGSPGFAHFDTVDGRTSEDGVPIKHVQIDSGHERFVSQGIAERVITAAMQSVSLHTVQVEKTEIGRFGRRKTITVPETESTMSPVTIGKVMRTTDETLAHVVGYDFLSRTPATQYLYRDDNGRPGRTLTTALVLPESGALELTGLLRAEPRLAREMAALVLQKRLGFSVEDMPMPDYEELDTKMKFVHFATSAFHNLDKGELITLDGVVEKPGLPE